MAIKKAKTDNTMLDILIIEDNPADVKLFKEYIKDSSLSSSRIYDSSSITEAARLINSHFFDIIVVDLSLPDSSGLDTMYRSNQLFRGFPIVILSGTDDIEVARRSVQEGIQDYLVKDKVDVISLERSISHAIERNKWKKEREEAEKNLRIKNKTLEQTNKKLEHFIYVISHDLRSPVTSILGIINILHEFEIEDTEVVKMLSLIEKSAHSLDVLLKDLLDILLSKANVSKKATLLQFDEVLTSVLNGISSKVIHADAKIHIDFSEVSSIIYPKAVMTSILLNLLTNAVKYRSNRRPLEIEIKTQKIDRDTCCLIVSDNGSGMDLEKVQNKVFQLFKRFHPNVEGKGVGLYIIKTMIEELGGYIEVESKPNVGTTFKVYLKWLDAPLDNSDPFFIFNN